MKKAEYEGLTLDEKIAKVAEEHEDPDEAASVLKKALSKVEAEAPLEKGPIGCQDLEGADKKEKGQAAGLWLLQKSQPFFRSSTHT